MTKPRFLTDIERAKVLEFQDMIHYSPRYSDDSYEYRHVMLPKNMLKAIPHDYFNQETGTLRILTEEEWRGLESHNLWVGPITKLMLQSLIYYYSRDP